MSSDSTPTEEEADKPAEEVATQVDESAAETPVETVATPEADTVAQVGESDSGSPAEDVATEVEEPAVIEEPGLQEPEVVAASEEESTIPEITLGSGDPADSSVDPDYVPVLRGKIDRFGVAMGTGRRKTSVARVRIKQGQGEFLVNGRSLDTYFGVLRDREMVLAPLKLTDKLGKVDVSVRVRGGGTTGQTGAVLLGISRALEVVEPALHHKLSEAGFLTRDGRMVERKKYGLRKARRSYQFSKR